MKSSSGVVKEPFFVLLYGTPGVGKSSFLSGAPKAKVIDVEGSTKKLIVDRFDEISSFDEVMEAIRQLRNDKHDYESTGIDSLDALEPLIFAKVCSQYGVKNIEDVGYGKGYTAAIEYWQQCINALKDLRSKRNMNIICIAHNQVKSHSDPMQHLPYDRHMIKLNEKAGAKWKEAVDVMIFATFEDNVFKLKNSDAKAKVSGSGVRKMYTTRRAAWDAKNRLGLPEELEFDGVSAWKVFSDAADAGQPDAAPFVLASLNEMMAQLGEKDKVSAEKMAVAINNAAGDINKLINIRNYARNLVAQ